MKEISDTRSTFASEDAGPWSRLKGEEEKMLEHSVPTDAAISRFGEYRSINKL